MSLEAERIVRALGGEWRHGQGLAPCPICQPEGRRDQRALSVSAKGGRVLMHCHKTGCAVFHALRERGLVELSSAVNRGDEERARRQYRARERERTDYANRLFESAECCAGTLVETYLASRGLGGIRLDRMHRTLRFHSSLPHGPSGQSLPTMLARIREVGGYPIGIHRTYLRPDGTGKADVTPAKMMLGRSANGAVRFGKDASVIAVAEGIETALSVRRSARVTCWAAMSAVGLKSLVFPPAPVAETVIIAADHDEAGLAAADALAARLDLEGRAVSIIKPTRKGQDFNDVLAGKP